MILDNRCLHHFHTKNDRHLSIRSQAGRRSKIEKQQKVVQKAVPKKTYSRTYDIASAGIRVFCRFFRKQILFHSFIRVGIYQPYRIALHSQ